MTLFCVYISRWHFALTVLGVTVLVGRWQIGYAIDIDWPFRFGAQGTLGQDVAR